MLELLLSMVIVCLFAGLAIAGLKSYRGIATRSVCSSSLRQLAAATRHYVNDHDGFFPPYLTAAPGGGRQWYFGVENSLPGTAEGKRDLDVTRGPLYPYIGEVGKIEVCPAFNYESALWKPKFKGASFAYGYNWSLGGRLGGSPTNINQLSSESRVILFGDCAQINTFQPPASPSKPMIEEFYIIDETQRSIHFRHNGRANILFVDGHVESMSPCPGTTGKVGSEVIGRITKQGSMDMLR